MSRSITRPIVGLALLSLACSDPPPTSFDPEELLTDLTLITPVVSQEAIRIENIVERGDRTASGPLLSEDDELGEQPSAQIFQPKTKAGFFTGEEAYAEGQHKYNGNVGRIETTAELYQGTQKLGTQVAVEQASVWFPFHFGQIEFITAYAPIHTSTECGLTAKGSSRHGSWFEFYVGVSVPRWGETETTSVGVPSTQPPCEMDEGNGTGGADVDADLTICIVDIWYDLETGEVLHIEVLSCFVVEA